MKPAAFLFVALLLAGCRTNESPEAQVNDIEITAQVKSKLVSDLGLSTVPNIAVNSTNGIVTLSGQVDSAALRTKAENIAKSVPKVSKVVDNLQIAATPPPAPASPASQ
ncbi:MAG TPA: BON domain-containing protein [Bryobacteraceae bacterium]|jgi:osmotically-inducible protein OsmY